MKAQCGMRSCSCEMGDETHRLIVEDETVGLP
jgi:hypothetical protein